MTGEWTQTVGKFMSFAGEIIKMDRVQEEAECNMLFGVSGCCCFHSSRDEKQLHSHVTVAELDETYCTCT